MLSITERAILYDHVHAERHGFGGECPHVEIVQAAEVLCVSDLARHRREIDLVVWERGCGITLACGTGACATAVAAVVTGRADEATPICVNLPGGSLEITVHPGLAAVSMKGPALHVFDGELDLVDTALWYPKMARKDFTVGMVPIEAGVAELLANLEYWRDAPVWTPDAIVEATQSWFKYIKNR